MPCKNCCPCGPFFGISTPVDYPVKSLKSSPLDCFGFRTKCCWCVPLRVASVLICVATLIWAALEIRAAENFIKRITDDKDAVYYLRMVYVVITIGLAVAAAILLLGILMSKYNLVNIYIWYVMVYLCIVVVFYLIGASIAVARVGKITSKVAIRFMLTIMWYTIAFYFLLIVNSYKSTLW